MSDSKKLFERSPWASFFALKTNYLKIVITILSLQLICYNTHATYKNKIGKIDRSTWPYSINTASKFDFASKMEMLVFSLELEKAEKIEHIDSLKKYLKLKSVNKNSIKKYVKHIKTKILHNFLKLKISSADNHIKTASITCWKDIIKEAKILKPKLNSNLKLWHHQSSIFYARYVYEQLRLAALFPRITSEILKLDQSEQSGIDFKDKHFLLTFDDGPTRNNGNTDKLIKLLEQNNKNGLFFVLGKNFKNRLKLNGKTNLINLYKNVEVGSHGLIHKVHPKYNLWKSSISSTHSLIKSTLNKNVRYFRPPYGQRNKQMVDFLKQKKQSVMLWNIDSQDWNSKINSNEVADRIISLMLLWRNGIILFHDIHSKAQFALPIIWNKLGKSGINWK